ncbi:MAG: VWA domain-containing protein [Thermodesulfobacteriota bacterium]
MNSRKLSQNIETDSYDRELFSEVEAESKELKDLIKRGSNLLPEFRTLVMDLFASFYKLNVILIPLDKMNKRSILTRKIVEMALNSEEYKTLREETALDGFKSAMACLNLSEHLIMWIKSDEGISKNTLIKEWEIKKAEENYNELKDQLRTWEKIEKSDKITNPMNDSLKYSKNKAKQKLNYNEEDLKELLQEQEERIERFDLQMQKQIRSSLNQSMNMLEDSENDINSWGTSIGMNKNKTIGEKLDLAYKLSKSERLKKLTQLVGKLKDEMLNSRRKIWSKRGTEVFDVSLGNDLGHIIPSELSTLRHKVLKKDFLKRFIEGKLLQYYLKDEKGRGPLIVCLDGSSSMEGDKEIWSKAVCLSLLEIARRENRKFEVIVYSSKGEPLKHFESMLREKRGMRDEDIIELAHYFPGGGTDFEKPLDRALELLIESKFKKGDIVFITDGECDVGEDWLQVFLKEKSRINFQVFSVLIDLTGRETAKTLSKFSDLFTTVSKLTSKDARNIFISIN